MKKLAVGVAFSKLVMGFAMFVLVALSLSGCGGDSSTPIGEPVMPPDKMSETLTLPSGHGLGVGGFTMQPGDSYKYGKYRNVEVSCPAGGDACVINVAADGTATYDNTGDVPAGCSVVTDEGPVAIPCNNRLR